jgi:hypothetical protein
VGFAEADATEEDDIGGGFEKRQLGEVLDLEAVDVFGPIPLEGIERFEGWEARPLNAPVSGTVAFVGGLSSDEFAEIVDMGPVFFSSLLGHLSVVIEDKGELEVG